VLDVLTSEDVRRQDAAAQAHGVSVATLMDNAGHAVARAVRELVGTTYGCRVVVVCGKGNNAGDGLVAARRLAAWGAHVTAVMTLETALEGAAGEALARFGGRVLPASALEHELGRADVVIDALFGIGLSHAPEGGAARAIEAINDCGALVVSVDVPSGLDADTGRVLGFACVVADVVVTFGGVKAGLLFAEDVASRIEVADIGVPQPERGGTALALEAHDVRKLMPVRSAGTNKRRVGTVLVVAGSRAMPGAAALVTGACVHAGAGLTTLAAPEFVTSLCLTRVPEATTIPLPESSEGTLHDKALEAIRPRLDDFHAGAIGPGLSTHPAALEAVRTFVAETTMPLVLDADSITAFAGNPGALKHRRGFTVLTPHAGEAARLLGIKVDAVTADRLGTARLAALQTGCVVLLKGPGTVIAAPDGRVLINITGNRGLAQGGTGDVLTGVIAGLLAQAVVTGADLVSTVAVGVWLHGRAADVAAERVAPHPANASMLIDLLPEVTHEVFA
jgi:ADP-dependent NAD(P)H-hydrate dehydratase / NAD(P)H-hydrate epimerase